MRREVKAYHISCDYCHISQIVHGGPNLPYGWVEVVAHCNDDSDRHPNGYRCLKDWCGKCKEGMTLERR